MEMRTWGGDDFLLREWELRRLESSYASEGVLSKKVLDLSLTACFSCDVLTIGEVAVLFYDSFTKSYPVYTSGYLAVRSFKVA